MGLAAGEMKGVDVEALMKHLYQTPERVADATKKLLGTSGSSALTFDNRSNIAEI
jgi:hypothetical protein